MWCIHVCDVGVSVVYSCLWCGCGVCDVGVVYSCMWCGCGCGHACDVGVVWVWCIMADQMGSLP